MPKLTRSNLLEALNLIDRQSYSNRVNNYKSLKVKKVCNTHDVLVGTLESLQSPGFNTNQQMLLSYLRRAVAVGDWASCATYTSFLVSMSGSLVPVMLRTCLLVLLNHKNSNPGCLNDFLEHGCRLFTVHEKRNFLKDVMTLKEEKVTIRSKKKQAEFEYFSSDEDLQDEILFLQSMQESIQ